MGKLLIAAACLFLIQSTIHAQAPDTVAAKITAAKDAFYADRDKAEQALIVLLEKKEAVAKQQGDIKTIETVRAELEAFRKEGKLPKSVPLATYDMAMNLAQTKLSNAYLANIKTCIQQNELEKAKELQKELDKLTPLLAVNNSFQVNSTWKDKSGHFLSVTQRTGESFRAQFGGRASNRVVIGTIKGDEVSWLRKDANVNKGNDGGDYYGTIIRSENGEYKMVVKYTEKSGKQGALTLELKP